MKSTEDTVRWRVDENNVIRYLDFQLHNHEVVKRMINLEIIAAGLHNKSPETKEYKEACKAFKEMFRELLPY